MLQGKDFKAEYSGILSSEQDTAIALKLPATMFTRRPFLPRKGEGLYEATLVPEDLWTVNRLLGKRERVASAR